MCDAHAHVHALPRALTHTHTHSLTHRSRAHAIVRPARPAGGAGHAQRRRQDGPWRDAVAQRLAAGGAHGTKDTAAMRTDAQVLVVRNDLGMGKGKIGAQCGHATLAAFLETQRKQPARLRAWADGGQPKIALRANTEEELYVGGGRRGGRPDRGHEPADAAHTAKSPLSPRKHSLPRSTQARTTAGGTQARPGRVRHSRRWPHADRGQLGHGAGDRARRCGPDRRGDGPAEAAVS